MAHPTPSPSPPAIPAFYKAVFLWIEPVSTLAGALYAHSYQSAYLELTHAATAPGLAVPVSTSIVLTQLANLYLLLCINEALVLRVTPDLRVWKTFLWGLLIADFGHLYSVQPVGSWVYWQFWAWNSIDWGNVGFVYFLALTRVCLLANVGVERNHQTGLKKSS